MARRFRNIAGPKIRQSRSEQGWTQEQMVAKLQLAGLELDRVGLAKIESQIRSLLDFELVVIAEVLGVTLNELLPSADDIYDELDDLKRGER